MDTTTRFWSKVDKSGGPDACWPWTASRDTSGYGQFKVGSYRTNDRRGVRAHRFAWETVNGSIPDGLCVCHRCDNRACCNPSHFFLGTNQENIKDRHSKGRNAVGPRNGNGKLSPQQVEAIRSAYPARTLESIGREHGISPGYVWKIVHKWNRKVM